MIIQHRRELYRSHFGRRLILFWKNLKMLMEQNLGSFKVTYIHVWSFLSLFFAQLLFLLPFILFVEWFKTISLTFFCLSFVLPVTFNSSILHHLYVVNRGSERRHSLEAFSGVDLPGWVDHVVGKIIHRDHVVTLVLRVAVSRSAENKTGVERPILKGEIAWLRLRTHMLAKVSLALIRRIYEYVRVNRKFGTSEWLQTFIA